MGTWDWDRVQHDLIPVSSAPKQAQLAAQIVPPEIQTEAYDKSLEELTGLPLLSLVEWSVSGDVPELFALLAEAGSQFGYVVGQGEGSQPSDQVRRIRIDAETARLIEEDVAFDPTMAFVDDKGHCALASWWSDHAWNCLREDLFDMWFSAADVNLTLWADEPLWPNPTTLGEAQRQAHRRQESWASRMAATREKTP